MKKYFIKEDWAVDYRSSLRGGFERVGKTGGGGTEEERFPGTTFDYKCSEHYFLDDDSNPNQRLQCLSNRQIAEKNASFYQHFQQIRKCYRKFCISNLMTD